MTIGRSHPVPLPGAGTLPGLYLDPPAASALLVFAHGAGAGMHHTFMEAASARLAERGIATLRFTFPYLAQGRKAPDREPVLRAAVCAAVEEGTRLAAGRPLFAGGKSMGGRMTSLAAAGGELPDGVCGLVFFGFPLHPAGRPGASRGDHLGDTALPLLFLQGDRDALAGLDLLRPVVAGLGSRATLHVEEGADHGFHVLKRSGRSDPEVLESMVAVAADWMGEQGKRPPGSG